MNSSSSKGGTYWGATGCGKSLIMLYLSKRSSKCSDLGKPTLLLVTDRTDLDEQLAGDFENATQYLVDKNLLIYVIHGQELLEQWALNQAK